MRRFVLSAIVGLLVAIPAVNVGLLDKPRMVIFVTGPAAEVNATPTKTKKADMATFVNLFNTDFNMRSSVLGFNGLGMGENLLVGIVQTRL